MKLSQYLADNRINDANFAAMIGSERTTVCRIRRGERLPSPSLMERIAKATDNNVLPNDFFVFGEPGPEPEGAAA